MNKQTILAFVFTAFLLSACVHSQQGEENTSGVGRRLYESIVIAEGFTHGVEGPAVDSRGNLYAVSFSDEGTIGIIPKGGKVSLFLMLDKGSTGNGIRFLSDGTMLVADYTGHNVLAVDMQTKAVRVYAYLKGAYQPNDLAVMDNDIVFASDPNWGGGDGALFRVMPDGTSTRIVSNIGTANGIEVSVDNTLLYVAESAQKRIMVYDVSGDGVLTNPRVFISFKTPGLDGMRTDVKGNVYVCRYDQKEVIKISPSGVILKRIPTASALYPSNLAFGGEDGKTVYVTVTDGPDEGNIGKIERFFVETPGRAWALMQMD